MTHSAILLITHLWNAEIEAHYRKLSDDSGADVWLLLDSRTPGVAELAEVYPRSYVFDVAQLRRLPYSAIPSQNLVGNAHLPLLAFFRMHSSYRSYWFVEYDVRYNGNWNTLFTKCDGLPHDFVTTHIRRYAQEPEWPWWQSCTRGSATLPLHEWVRSFNVIFRISSRALRFLDQALRGGWRGHHEALLVTMLLHHGFSVADLGGDGEFVAPGFTNAFYTSAGSRRGWLSARGTVRFQPAHTRIGRKQNFIYHPVKPPEIAKNLTERIKMYARWMEESCRDAIWALSRRRAEATELVAERAVRSRTV